MISPFLRNGPGEIVPGLLLLYTLVAILKSIDLPRLFLTIYMGLALFAFSLQIISILDIFPASRPILGIIVQGSFALYLGGSAYWISRDIVANPKATLDTVQGGISVYLLLGFIWALLYGMVAIANPEAFSPPLNPDASFLRALHFSFTTLTTLGYGDIVPKGDLALVLTNLEAIAGQMYSSIFIAILVGGYLISRRP
ncbi:potassium channel family protein [[Leptolyngbya] sp. PCC 7376]|uniref:potassium channel family protein n=1 Tax=[Leptolyngbya] sp. PCC 7376 TaxID=111781 RepID=UPI001CEDF8FE|nr:potassium channel family protein [[Leptolyngbya] sp. PCC 7376]